MILGLHNPCNKAIRVFPHPLNLLREQSLIEVSQIPKSHSTLRLWNSYFAPTHSMDFPIIPLLTSPKILHKRVYFRAKRFRKKENTHTICRDGLNKGLNQNLLSHLRQELKLLVFEPLPYPVNYMLESRHSRPPHQCRQSQVSLIALGSGYSRQSHNIFFVCICGITAKEN